MFTFRRMASDLGSVIVVPIDQNSGRLALIREPQKPLPHYWKFPGGKIENRDIVRRGAVDLPATARRAAIREALEETGLHVRVLEIGIRPRNEHTQYLFAGLADFTQIRSISAQGEEVRVCTISEIENMRDFFRPHLAVLSLVIEKITR